MNFWLNLLTVKIFWMSFFNKIKKFYYLKILKKRYYRFGSCKMCGACCTNIYVRHKSSVIKTESEFEEIKKTDNCSFYKDIKVISKDDFGLVFECCKFDKEKRLCTDHKNRPQICRNYPSEDIFKMGAILCDDCGFRFEPIEKFDEVLAKVSKKPVKNFEQL